MLEDSNKNAIRRIKVRMINLEYILKNKKGDIILKVNKPKKKNDINKYCEITNSEGKIVAGFAVELAGSTFKRWLGNWWDDFIIHIHDKDVDRRALLGLVMAIVKYKEGSSENKRMPAPI